ncbi:MAG: PadR family transcriptional regulator [Chloroflexota bacterium]
MSPMVRRPPGIELALLGFLRDGPQHGYQIHLLMEDPNGLKPIWKLKQSQLYALLANLEKDGLTGGVLEVQDTARPPRRVFHLTRAGQTAFQKWLSSPVSNPRLMRQEFMAKLYFSSKEGGNKVVSLVNAQKLACRDWLNEIKAEKVDPGSYQSKIYRYRLGQLSATLQWLDDLSRELEETSASAGH